LMPAILQKIALQPVSCTEAEKLDKLLLRSVNEYFKWQPNVKGEVLLIRIEDNGLEILSIADINAVITVKSLHRDLNHPNEATRRLARITLLDWKFLNKGHNPIEDPKDKMRKDQKGQIPAAWLTAEIYMNKIGLKIAQMDAEDEIVMKKSR
jgi:hypothetical protein